MKQTFYAFSRAFLLIYAFSTTGVRAESTPAQPVPTAQLSPASNPAEPQRSVSLSAPEVRAVEFVIHHKGEALWKETFDSLNSRQIQILDDWNRAQGNIDLGRYDEALALLREAGGVLPDDSDIRDQISRLTAIAPFTPRLQLLGKGGEIMRQGINLYLAGDTSTGLHRIAYSVTLGPVPAHRELFKNLSASSGQTIDLDLDSPMDGVEQKLSAALLSFRAGDYVKSTSLCEEALLMDPNNALAYKRLGSSFYALGNYDKAREAWTRSLELNPGDPKKKETLGYIKRAKEKGVHSHE